MKALLILFAVLLTSVFASANAPMSLPPEIEAMKETAEDNMTEVLTNAENERLKQTSRVVVSAPGIENVIYQSNLKTAKKHLLEAASLKKAGQVLNYMDTMNSEFGSGTFLRAGPCCVCDGCPGL